MTFAFLAAAALAFQPVPLPAYGKELAEYADRAGYQAAVNDRRFAMRRIAYQSDGLTVFAYVYGPRGKPAKPRPVVVFNRGSYVRDAFAGEMLPLAHRVAEAGFIVVAPFYRGSGGASGHDEMGGAELDDLFALVPVIASISGADSRQLYLYGESRGGMMVYQALRDGFPARAAAVYGAFTDLAGLLQDPRWEQTARQLWPDFDQRREAIVTRRSALRWPERLDVPLLIMQGGADKSVPPAQSLALAEALDRLHKPFELWIAAGSNHVLTDVASERDARAVAWFRKAVG